MLDIVDPRDRLMGRAIIDALDPSGWFTADLAGFACGLGALPEDAERVLLRLQQFEPAGLFARSLAECLALQLRDRDRYSPAMAALLDNLDLPAAGHFDALGKACGVDGEELARMVRELRSLDPKPASALDGEAAALPVIPDILVRAHPGGGWAVELNDEVLPRVLCGPRLLRAGARVCGVGCGPGVPRGPAEQRQLAGKSAAPEGGDHAQGRRRAGAPAAGLLRARGPASAPADAPGHRRRGRNPREHGQSRDGEQIHGLAPRPLRAQIFLHRRHSRNGRGGPLGRSRPAPAKGADRTRKSLAGRSRTTNWWRRCGSRASTSRGG